MSYEYQRLTKYNSRQQYNNHYYRFHKHKHFKLEIMSYIIRIDELDNLKNVSLTY